MYQMREEKISDLEQKLRHSTNKFSSLQELKSRTKERKELAEVERMQRAFKDLVVAEGEKQKDRMEREERRTVIKDRKNRSVLNKFVQAENIRMEHRSLRQSRIMKKFMQ